MYSYDNDVVGGQNEAITMLKYTKGTFSDPWGLDVLFDLMSRCFFYFTANRHIIYRCPM